MDAKIILLVKINKMFAIYLFIYFFLFKTKLNLHRNTKILIFRLNITELVNAES